MANHDVGLPSLILLQHCLFEASILRWDPHRLLGIIGLVHVSPLHVIADNQIGQRVRIGLIAAAQLDVARHLGRKLVV